MKEHTEKLGGANLALLTLSLSSRFDSNGCKARLGYGVQ